MTEAGEPLVSNVSWSGLLVSSPPPLSNTENLLQSTAAAVVTATTGTIAATAAATAGSGWVSAATKAAVQWVLGVAVFPTLFLAGSVMNVLTLVTLWAAGLGDHVHLVLFCLALADLCSVVTFYVPLSHYLLRYVDVVASIVVREVTGARFETASFLFSRASAMFVSLIAAERFIFVVFPLRAASLLTARRLRVTCAGIFLLWLALGSPLLLITEVRDAFYPELNRTLPEGRFTTFYYQNRQFVQTYAFVFIAVVFRIGPVLLVTLLTACVVLTLHRSRRWSAAASASREAKQRVAQDRRVTRTLVSVCVLFVATNAPYVLYHLMLVYMDGFRAIRRLAYDSVSVLEMINSSANFVLYVTTSRKFSATFRRVFWRFRAWDQDCSQKPDSSITALSDGG